MALLLCDGFDSYAAGDIGRYWPQAFSVTLGTGGRFGTNRVAQSSITGSIMQQQLAANYTTLICGAAVRYDQTTGSVGLEVPFFLFADKNSSQNQLSLSIEWNSGRIKVYRGNQAVLLGTTTLALSLGVYYYIEFKVTFATGATGSFEVRVNGDTVLSGTNVITANTNPYANNFSLWNRWTGNNTQTFMSFDDFYLCDDSGTLNNDFRGDSRVFTSVPVQDGDYAQFAPSGGAVPHYTMVDDATPNDDTDYNSSATVGDKDSFYVTDLSGAGAIFGVQVTLRTRKDDAGSRRIAPLIRQTATDAQGSSVSILDDYMPFRWVFEQNPVTSSAWAVSEINTDAQFGYVVTA